MLDAGFLAHFRWFDVRVPRRPLLEVDTKEGRGARSGRKPDTGREGAHQGRPTDRLGEGRSGLAETQAGHGSEEPPHTERGAPSSAASSAPNTKVGTVLSEAYKKSPACRPGRSRITRKRPSGCRMVLRRELHKALTTSRSWNVARGRL